MDYVTAIEAVELIGKVSRNAKQVLKRMLHFGWLDLKRKGSPGVRMKIQSRSLIEAIQRLQSGEKPPLMQVEIKDRQRTREKRCKGVRRRQ
jgi:hypothetical protein